MSWSMARNANPPSSTSTSASRSNPRPGKRPGAEYTKRRLPTVAPLRHYYCYYRPAAVSGRRRRRYYPTGFDPIRPRWLQCDIWASSRRPRRRAVPGRLQMLAQITNIGSRFGAPMTRPPAAFSLPSSRPAGCYCCCCCCCCYSSCCCCCFAPCRISPGHEWGPTGARRPTGSQSHPGSAAKSDLHPGWIQIQVQIKWPSPCLPRPLVAPSSELSVDLSVNREPLACQAGRRRLKSAIKVARASDRLSFVIGKSGPELRQVYEQRSCCLLSPLPAAGKAPYDTQAAGPLVEGASWPVRN